MLKNAWIIVNVPYYIFPEGYTDVRPGMILLDVLIVPRDCLLCHVDGQTFGCLVYKQGETGD